MKKHSVEGKWLTTEQVASLIGLVTTTVVGIWCREGILPSVKVRRRWHIHKERFLKMLNELEWPYHIES